MCPICRQAMLSVTLPSLPPPSTHLPGPQIPSDACSSQVFNVSLQAAECKCLGAQCSRGTPPTQPSAASLLLLQTDAQHMQIAPMVGYRPSVADCKLQPGVSDATTQPVMGSLRGDDGLCTNTAPLPVASALRLNVYVAWWQHEKQHYCTATDASATHPHRVLSSACLETTAC